MLKYAVGFILFIALVLGFSSYFTVGVGDRAFTVRFGNVNSEVFTEGLHWKNPFLDSVIKLSVKNKRIDRQVNSASKDLQNVVTDMNLNYSINPTAVISLYKSVGSESSIEDILVAPTIQESVKAATAKYTAEELITKREEVRNLIIDNLKGKLSERGLLINDVNIINFEFSAQFNTAIESKVQAEQDALAQKNVLDKVRYEAQQDVERYKAEAEKIRIQSESVNKAGGQAYIELKKLEVMAKFAEKWNGNVPQFMTSSDPVSLLNLNDLMGK